MGTTKYAAIPICYILLVMVGGVKVVKSAKCSLFAKYPLEN